MKRLKINKEDALVRINKLRRLIRSSEGDTDDGRGV